MCATVQGTEKPSFHSSHRYIRKHKRKHTYFVSGDNNTSITLSQRMLTPPTRITRKMGRSYAVKASFLLDTTQTQAQEKDILTLVLMLVSKPFTRVKIKTCAFASSDACACIVKTRPNVS